MKYMTLGDKILIAVIILASVASIFFIPRLLTTPAEGKTVVVNLDGEEIYRLPLTPDSQSSFYEFDFQFGGKDYVGVLEMKDGRVMLHRLPEEISPLSIHTDMGWISESYQVIVCLPIKLFIVVESTVEEETDFDIIVY